MFGFLCFFLLLGISHGQQHIQKNYEPCYQQVFTVTNTINDERTDEISIDVDTKALADSSEKKLDPDCRDLRIFTNQTTGIMKYVTYWFEDKCGTTSTTRIWLRLHLLSNQTIHIFVQYASDLFVETEEPGKDYYDYQLYTDSNMNHFNNSKRWKGDFFKISTAACDDAAHNDGTGDFPYDEAHGRMLLSRGGTYTNHPAMFLHDDPNDPSITSYHSHDAVLDVITDNPFPYETMFNATVGTFPVMGLHKHQATSDPSVMFMSSPHDPSLMPMPYLPQYTNYYFCRSSYNSITRQMGVLVDSNVTYPGWESVVTTTLPNYFKARGIRLANNETGEGGCEDHGASNFTISNYSETKSTFDTIYVKENPSGVDYPALHAHFIEFSPAKTSCIHEMSKTVPHRKTCLLKPSSDVFDVRLIKGGITMASEKPLMGYKTFNWGTNDEFDLRGYDAVPLYVYDTNGEYIQPYDPSDWDFSGKWARGFAHAHKPAGWTQETRNLINVKIEQGTFPTTPIPDPTHSHPGVLKNTFGKTSITNTITYNWQLGYNFTSKWYGFMPFYFVKKESAFISMQVVQEQRLLAEDIQCQRGARSPLPITGPTTTTDDGSDDFQWAFVYGPGSVLFVGVCCIFPALILAVVVVLCFCCVFVGFWIVVIILVVLMLLVSGVIILFVAVLLAVLLGGQFVAFRAIKAKETTNLQLEIAKEKSKARKEKKAADEEIQAIDAEEDELEKELEEVEEELQVSKRKKNKGKLKIIEFDDVKQGKRMAKGYLGSKVYRGDWEGKKVMFHVYPTKAFKTKKFNIFGKFEDELREYSVLKHPSLLRYIGYSIMPDVGVITEYCPKSALPVFFRKGSMGLKLKVTFLSMIAEGMLYLHENGVVHRDLQAGSVFVAGGIVPKIDFGFGKTFGRKYECSQYAAPELIYEQSLPDDDGELPIYERFDMKCDVFSFGILMFELAMAMPKSQNNFNAYDVESKSEEIALKVAEDREYRPDFEGFDAQEVPKWFMNLAEACWEHDARDRVSFKEVIRILKEHSGDVEDESEGSSSSGTDSDEDRAYV